MKIVITGCIGSGKSTVSKLMMKYLPEFEFISVDSVVKALYEDADIKEKLMKAFGTCDRKEISGRVFSNPLDMNYIRHIFDDTVSDVVKNFLDSNENCVVEFPLYFDFVEEFENYFDATIIVTASHNVCLSRAMKRDGITREKACSILSRQSFPHSSKYRYIRNEYPLNVLEQQIQYIADGYRRK